MIYHVSNPLTALWGVTNGELMEFKDSDLAHSPQAIRKQVVNEIYQVATALNPTWPSEVVSPDALDSFVGQLIQENAKNRSSMYYDVKLHRRTEIDSLNGFVFRKAQELGIQTPVNEEVYLRIKEATTDDRS